MKRILLLPLVASLLLITGCSDEEDFSRYPSVWIPEYIYTDYIPDLSDPNPELVYNATCNLGRRAGQFSKVLCAEDADPDSSEYKTAEEVHRRICSQLEVKEPYTVAATLRFLQYFAKEYEPKDELVDMVSRIENDHPQVQFEQVTLLMNYAAEETRLPGPLMRRLIDSPSWVVSRTTYGLIGKLQDEPLRQELIRRYQRTDDERDRLILLAALCQRLKPEEARLLEEEMFKTEVPKIRHVIGMTLMENLHVPGVKQWLSDHYPQLNDKEKAILFVEADIELACQILAMGYIPADEFLTELAAPPSDDEEEDERVARLRIEKAIQANPKLAGRLATMKEEAKQEQLRKNALREEVEPLSQVFMADLKVVLTKHEMSEEDRKKALEMVSKALEPLTGK